ncbi:MAG: exodeoxyribonuclease VII small subunit [Rikenellaceae bacterium]|nr:exodeoxyribonuclease VII small subunit [Rikenellaceae bacterium]
MATKKMTYAEAAAEIEQILARMKQEQASNIDTLAADVKRATELIAYCREQLRSVEQAVNAQLEE